MFVIFFFKISLLRKWGLSTLYTRAVGLTFCSQLQVLPCSGSNSGITVTRGLGCLPSSIHVPTPPWFGLLTRFIQPVDLHLPSTPDPRGEGETYSPQEIFPQYVIYLQYIHPVRGYLARHQLETAHSVGAEVHHVQSPPPLLLRCFPPNPQSFLPLTPSAVANPTSLLSTEGEHKETTHLLQNAFGYWGTHPSWSVFSFAICYTASF